MTESGLWGDATAVSLFRDAVSDVPSRTALVDPPDRRGIDGQDPRRLTFAELGEQVDRMGALLRAHGIGRDDIVVAQLPNVVDQIIIYLALMELGAIVSPVPTQYGTHELRHIVAETKPRAFLTVAELKGQPFLDPRRSAFPEGTLLGAIGGHPDPDVLALTRPEPSEAELAEHRARCDQRTPDPNDINTLCWTSGTTGTPKGVPRHHNHWISQSLNTARSGPIDDGAAMLNPFPFVNMASFGGFFYLWLIYRGKLVLHHPFTMTTFLKQLVDEEINYTVAAPTVLSRLLQGEELAGLDLSHLKLIASGSAPLGPAMVRGFAERYQVEIANMYGSNEGVSMVGSATAVPDPEKRSNYFPRFGAAGMTWDNPGGMRTKLIDLETQEEITEPGVSGELLYWGPTVFDGYWNSPEDNRLVFDEDGYFHSGDLLEIVPEDPRFYRILGRTKDIIVRGGMKLSPDELDVLIGGFEAVSEGAVCAYPDDDMGERVAAVVVPRPDTEVSLKDLTDYLSAQGLAKFKLPERLLITDELPRNPLGKLVRKDLQAWVAAQDGEQR